MESTQRWITVAAGAAMLALGACSATGPTQARGEPALRFSSPPDNAGESRDVRRDAYGRPIHFREVPLDRHGTVRDADARQEPVCGRNRCAEDGGGAASRGGDGP